ncbi:dihydrofolate reductase family protein [Parasutterella secunda]|uniref:Dihydrofolate reductase family protein n=1 Tax=Parasutterella secunda TaxID=626947 RepID=A0ABS2GWJ0_9BURK|nr:dihydrofolate reductase family protein [Parasutterella secunda]MBM6929202.1 dihydrofolate reductase family protein [Parasutterella secunda]
MTKPYIVCHMMASIAGRIDCKMTEKIQGVEQYYETLEALNTPTTVSGRVTALLELAQDGQFQSSDSKVLGHEAFSKKTDADGYCVVVDTKGTLLWTHPKELSLPLIVVTGTNVQEDYLKYLDSENISWIAVGADKIDLVKACEILVTEFNVKRMAIVGGGHINAGFLAAGLLDEVSLVLGPAIDGRGEMAALFDGLPMQKEPTQLKLQQTKTYPNGVLHLLYKVL